MNHGTPLRKEESRRGTSYLSNRSAIVLSLPFYGGLLRGPLIHPQRLHQAVYRIRRVTLLPYHALLSTVHCLSSIFPLPPFPRTLLTEATPPPPPRHRLRPEQKLTQALGYTPCVDSLRDQRCLDCAGGVTLPPLRSHESQLNGYDAIPLIAQPLTAARTQAHQAVSS